MRTNEPWVVHDARRADTVTYTVSALTLGNLDKLPSHTRRCVFWEIDPAVSRSNGGISDPLFEKEAWLSMVMLQWGSCGQVATADGVAAGCALYAPPSHVPRAELFPTSPVSPDAVLLTTLRVESVADTDDLAGRLVQAVVADLVRRGVRALEAFGIRPADDVDRPDVPSATAALDCSPDECMIRADFLETVGFETVAPHRRFPRLRLELHTDHGWKEDVEYALDQLLAAAMLQSERERGVLTTC